MPVTPFIICKGTIGNSLCGSISSPSSLLLKVRTSSDENKYFNHSDPQVCKYLAAPTMFGVILVPNYPFGMRRLH